MKQLKKIYFIFEFIVYYLKELVLANMFMAYDILTPKMYMKPAFMEVNLKIKSDAGLLLFSNLISMTPGTLSIDLSKDKKRLLVHVLYYSTDELMHKNFDEIQNKIIRITE